MIYSVTMNLSLLHWMTKKHLYIGRYFLKRGFTNRDLVILWFWYMTANSHTCVKIRSPVKKRGLWESRHSTRGLRNEAALVRAEPFRDFFLFLFVIPLVLLTSTNPPAPSQTTSSALLRPLLPSHISSPLFLLTASFYCFVHHFEETWVPIPIVLKP